MKYYLIVGEASGDLHASHLRAALKEEDPSAGIPIFQVAIKCCRRRDDGETL